MDDLLFALQQICPDAGNDTYYRLPGWYNRTIFANRTWQLAAFACRYDQLNRLIEKVLYLNNYLNIIGWVIGYPSAVFALIILSTSEYKTRISFFYHRLINVIELVSMTFLFYETVKFFSPSLLNRYAFWAYFNNYVVIKLQNACVVWVNFIVLWLTVERAVACLAPSRFALINRARVAYACSFAAFFLAFAVMLPESFYVEPDWNEHQRMYRVKVTSFGRSPAYGAYVNISVCVLLISAGLLLAATAAALIGYRSFVVKRRKNLSIKTDPQHHDPEIKTKQQLQVHKLKNSPSSNLPSTTNFTTACETNVHILGPSNSAAKQLRKQYALDTQLCLLQLCETLPLAVNQLIFSLIKFVNPLPFGSVKSALMAAPSNYDFEQAVKELNEATLLTHLLLPNNFSAIVAHCCHFYWYVAFCPKYRRTVAKMMRAYCCPQPSHTRKNIDEAELDNMMG